jgi:hypothetical protein
MRRKQRYEQGQQAPPLNKSDRHREPSGTGEVLCLLNDDGHVLDGCGGETVVFEHVGSVDLEDLQHAADLVTREQRSWEEGAHLLSACGIWQTNLHMNF